MDHDWNNTSDTNRTNNRHGSSSLALSQHATDMPQGPLNEDFKFFLASLDFATTAGDVREWISTVRTMYCTALYYSELVRMDDHDLILSV